MTEEIEYQFPATMQLHDAFISGMASILEAEYRPGEFAAAFERFREDREVHARYWFLRGRHGSFRVRMERDETHLHCLLKSHDPQVFAGKALMLQEPSTRHTYGGIHFIVGDEFLCAMASLLEAEYREGDFEQAFEALYEKGSDAGWQDNPVWRLRGRHGDFFAEIAQGESLLACTLLAQEPQFSAGKRLMKDAYLSCGGNPARLKP